MSTTRNFQDMLNEYLPNELLKEELIKRDYVLTKVQKDENWKGGNMPVPFKGAGASSVKMGGLTTSADIAQSRYIRGNIASQVEVWGSLIFNQRDLMEHDGKLNEDSFLSILPGEIEEFMDYVKEVVSIQLGSGPHFATGTDSTNGNTGKFVVNRIDRFQVDQHVVIDDDNSASTDFYVIAVDVNTKTVTGSATRGGAAADFSAYTVSQNVKFYHDGATDGAGNYTTFLSMRQALLSAANGGATNLHGIAKTAWPILQAYNINGSDITSSNLLEKLFDAYSAVRQVCKGQATEFVMSLKHIGTCMKLLEAMKGAYVVTSAPKKSLFGWTEISIANVATGQDLKLVGIQEMDDDIIPIMDWRNVTFRTNGFFHKRKSPDGKEFYEVRNTTGYQYIVDICLFGEMEYRKAGHSAVIYGVNY